MNDATNMTGKRKGGACIMSMLLAMVPLAYADETPTAYVMTVILDQAQGDRLVEGDYNEVIREIETVQRQKSRTGFASSNNLCVAYVKTNRLADAEQACSDALRNSKAGNPAWYPQSRRMDHAVALSNRGVIRAVTGDVESARQDFSVAMRLGGSQTAAAENLAKLDAAIAAHASASARQVRK